MGVLDKATTVAEDPGPWSILIYGDAGAGKTVFACQAEGPLLMDYERGRRSLLNHPELVGTPIRKIDSLNEAKQVAIDLARDNDERIKTVILDTVTTAQFKDMTSQMKKLPERNDLPSQGEFNKNNRRITKLVEELMDACEKTNRNLVILAHIKEDKDDEGLTTLIRPGTSPALTSSLAPMVSGIFYLAHVADSKGEVTRTLKTLATKKVKGKNRFGTLPAEIVNPHFSVIEKAANEQRQYALQLLAEKS